MPRADSRKGPELYEYGMSPPPGVRVHRVDVPGAEGEGGREIEVLPGRR